MWKRRTSETSTGVRGSSVSFHDAISIVVPSLHRMLMKPARLDGAVAGSTASSDLAPLPSLDLPRE